MAGAISGAFNSFGGAVADFFGSEGSQEAAQGEFAAAVSYANAADIAEQNKKITENATQVQEIQQQRKNELTEGSITANVGANGGTGGGSAGDLMRMSIQQGALAKSVISQQGAINENTYEQQAQGLYAQEAAATAAGNAELAASEGQMWGGILKIGGGILGLFGL